MKIFSIASLAILLSGFSAFARLGETPNQCQMRYGSSTGQSGPYFTYYKDHFDIMVLFRDGKSVEETFFIVGAVLSEENISEFLNANSDGSSWKTSNTSSYRHYQRLDNRAYATLNHGKLTVQTRAESKTEIIVPGKQSTSGF